MAVEVSVRELRQNLSVHLRRVQDGETLAVTNRGKRVAILSPIGGGSRIDRLIAEGRVIMPTDAGSIEPPPPVELDGTSPTPGTDALMQDRDEDLR